MYGGSICLTELIEQAKKGHSSFSKAQNGKVYFNMLTWMNEEEDKYGNTVSHQLSSAKEKRESEGKVYIGNSKPLQTSKPVSANDVKDDFLDKIPARPQTTEKSFPATDDLPF